MDAITLSSLRPRAPAESGSIGDVDQLTFTSTEVPGPQCPIEALASAMLSQNLLGTEVWQDAPSSADMLSGGATSAAVEFPHTAPALPRASSRQLQQGGQRDPQHQQPHLTGSQPSYAGQHSCRRQPQGPLLQHNSSHRQQQQRLQNRHDISPSTQQQQQQQQPQGHYQQLLQQQQLRSPMSNIQRMYQRAASSTAEALGGGMPDGTPPKRFSNVEEILEIVRALPSWASAVEAVAHNLYIMDNQAFAALLKALGKAGQSCRAFELFDWVTRQIDECGDTRLAGLSDTYTYTTIISLGHGSRENCRRGMQYFAQMRQHNVPPNTFTYTALMSVCMRVNEAETALDVYHGMLDAGLRPSAITYKIALDAYCRSELWDEAFSVVTDMQLKGLNVEERMYTLAFMALGRTSTQPPPEQSPNVALRLYKQLRGQLPGRLPGAALHANIIKAFSRVGMSSAAMHFFRLIPENEWSEPAVRDLAESFAVAGMAAEAQQVLSLLPSCKQPPSVDTRGVCSSWNGHECFFQNLHGTCKYMHSHRIGRSNKMG